MMAILAFDTREHMVVFQKILGKDHKDRQSRWYRYLEIDRVSVTILMGNSTDLLLTNSAHAVRPVNEE